MTSGSRILVVDDEEGLRVSLAANLELEGYEVVEASDGLQAVEQVRANAFDLVITDVRMPRLDGIDAFREIRRLRPGTDVVLMTAFTSERLVEQLLGEGVYTVLPKPFDMARLADLVSRVLERRAILVLDDDPQHIAEILGVLRTVGLRAETASDAEAATALVREQKIDVCVLDLAMAGTAADRMYEEIRRLDASLIVVAISSDAPAEAMHHFMNLGGCVCLRRPFDVHELVRAIARARGRGAAR